MGPAPKKRKVVSSTELAQLADDLNEKPREKANNVPVLISFITSKDHQVLPIIQGLKVYFVGCFEREELQTNDAAPSAGQPQDPQAVYASWLHRQFSSCITALLANLTSGTDARTQIASLAALMEFTRGKRAGVFDNELAFKVFSCILTSEHVAPEAMGAILEKYAEHADLNYYLLRSISKLCTRRASRPAPRASSNGGNENPDGASDEEEGANGDGSGDVSIADFARNVFDLISRLPPPSHDPAELLLSWCGAAEEGVVAPATDASGPRQRKKQRKEQQEGGHSGQMLTAKWASAKHRQRAYSDAWMAFLRLDLPDDIYRKTLSRLHDLVIPNLTTPLLLSDFLSHSLDRGGLDGMLALNGIFILVTQHGLEYPKFYERLYSLLNQDAFLSRHRLRFFQLADIFLASPMVPAYTAAAFAKRFARLALNAPPAGALVAIVFIHNLLRRHPACAQLIHRANPYGLVPTPEQEVALKQKAAVWRGEDVYDPTEPDPANARALESTLWELTALRAHADPSVSGYCSILDKDLSDRRRTAEVDVGDVLTASYTSLFTREVERRLKQVPAAFYAEAPSKVMSEQTAGDFPGWTD